jgi:hypothetical protein
MTQESSNVFKNGNFPKAFLLMSEMRQTSECVTHLSVDKIKAMLRLFREREVLTKVNLSQIVNAGLQIGI